MTPTYVIAGREQDPALARRLLERGFGLMGRGATIEAWPEVDARILKERIVGPGADIAGVLVTSPLHASGAGICDEVARDAQESGVVTSITRAEGRLRGRDVLGPTAGRLVRWLQKPAEEEPVLILGTGAAAEATVAHLAGVHVTVAGRDAARLSRFASAWRVAIEPWERAVEALPRYRVVVNATSAKAPCRLDGFEGRLLDFHHATAPTPWESYAQENGLPFAGGRDLLLGRVANALQHWTGERSPVERLRDALEAAA